MVRTKEIQGKIYWFKSESRELGSSTPAIPKIVRIHPVLVLDIVRGKKDYVKIMTITSTLKNDAEYVPIAPTPKKGYAIQLRLRNHLEWYGGQLVCRFSTLPKYSYLKIDESYEVPIQMLEEAVDCAGRPLMVLVGAKAGGLVRLRSYIQRRDRAREEEELWQMMENQSLGEEDFY